MIVPISVVIPTRDRPEFLRRVLNGFLAQSAMPAEIIIIDASLGGETKNIVEEYGSRAGNLGGHAVWRRADIAGAAIQRNQGVAMATHDVIAFFDDDILFEPECIARLWAGLQSDPQLGGVNAMITNQQYHPPGKVSRLVFRVLSGGARKSYAGLVLGPAVQLLPEDREDLPGIVPTEWLNSTATLYRREALPDPPFERFFTGYSLMEDLTLSLIVGRRWKLANVRNARIFHDSQPGLHKSDPAALAKMELVNRHFVMTRILCRKRMADYCKLLLWETFQLFVAFVQSPGGRNFRNMVAGKFQAVLEIAGAQSRENKS